MGDRGLGDLRADAINALRQPHSGSSAAGTRKAAAKRRVAGLVIDPRIDALQGLIDRAEFKHFDQRMEASMVKSMLKTSVRDRRTGKSPSIE